MKILNEMISRSADAQAVINPKEVTNMLEWSSKLQFETIFTVISAIEMATDHTSVLKTYGDMPYC